MESSCVSKCKNKVVRNRNATRKNTTASGHGALTGTGLARVQQTIRH
jgi:hypothetical protein